MLGQPAACILLLTTGATAFDYLASLTVQDAATVAKPAAKDTSYLESLPTAPVASLEAAVAAPDASKPAVAAAATIKEAVAAAPVLVPRTDPSRIPRPRRARRRRRRGTRPGARPRTTARRRTTPRAPGSGC